jgi:UDP-3-O-[3-hydroxymyristoyl] glucosamine N-acyltransferase
MLTVRALAKLLGLPSDGFPDRPIARVMPLHQAQAEDLSYIGDARFCDALRTSNAGFVLASEGISLPPTSALVVRVPDANAAMASVLEAIALPVPRPDVGIHPSASVARSADVHATARVAAGVHVGDNAVVSAGVVLHPGVVVCSDVVIGEGSELFANVVLRERVRLGKRVVIHAGSVVGTDGFGYRWDGKRHAKLIHVGSVHIDDDVEIGSCTCIDRGKFGDTYIGPGTKIDNHVQVGHNVRIGAHCILCGQVGIAGSVELGNGVVMGARSGVGDNRQVGDRAMIAGMSGVGSNVEPGSKMAGMPAVPLQDWLRQTATIHKLPELIAEIRDLKREVESLRSKLSQ